MSGKGSGGSRVLVAAVVGAILGALAALLLTPKTGPQMRRQLRVLAGDTKKIPEAVEEASGAASKAFKKSLTDGKDKK